jgi:hypothetical protein
LPIRFDETLNPRQEEKAMMLTMIRNLITALLLSAAVGLMPQGAAALAGHDHGAKAKKVKKSKHKNSAVELRLMPART